MLGFRTNKVWKKILSVIYLIYCALYALGVITTGRYEKITVYDFWIDKLYGVVLLLVLLSPYIFLSNTKFRNKLPLFKKHSTGASIAGMAIISLSLVILSGFVNGLHSQEYLADMENHAYIEVSVVSATCETDGKIERHCEYCGKDTTEQVKAMGHSWDVIATEATCTTPGVCTYVCTVCNNTRTEEINALGHTWDSGNTTTEATCTNAGVLTYTCTVCNDTKTEEVNAFGHDWGNATCESPSICNRCGDTKDSALGHTTDCGVCSRCNKEIRKQSPVTILDWTYNIDYVGGVEWNFKIRNNTDKQIKYVTMQWSCYNAVGDLIYCQIDRKSYKRVRFTGPLDAYTISESKRTTDKFYNYNLKSYKMNEIIVEYMDGTTETITNYHDNILG